MTAPTVFSAIVNAFLTRLAEAPAVCETRYRARTAAIPDTGDAINVYFQGSLPHAGRIGGAPVDWQSRVVVECYSTNLRDSGDLAVDPLMRAVYERLAQDCSLGGLVDDIGYPSIEPEQAEEGARLGLVRMVYLVRHQTGNNTL